jgi:hypothetical protein
MRLAEIDVATDPRSLTPDEIAAVAQGMNKKINIDPKVKARVDKKAQSYVKPLMGKWQEALAAQANIGKDIDDPNTQRLILAGIISRYAGISPNDVDILEKKILASDLTDEKQVAVIFKTAVTMTLFQRIAKSTGPEKSIPVTKPQQATPAVTEPPEEALVTDNGVQYYYRGGKWYSAKDDLAVRIPELSAELNNKAISAVRLGKLTRRK